MSNMLYSEPFVLYLNVCICIILLLLILPTLFNNREDIKIRIAFALVFFTVIVNCSTNVLVFLFNNYNYIPIVFLLFFIPLLFGPAVLYYVKGILGFRVSKNIVFSFIPGILSFIYGLFLIISDDNHKMNVLKSIVDGNHHFFNITNLITLFYILMYCVKSWLFLKRINLNSTDTFYQQLKLKKKWGNEFVLFIFAHVFVFFIIHSATVAKLIPVTALDLELVWMPIFLLFVYLIIAIRSTMMYKEFEHQFVIAKIESEKSVQNQRIEIARDLHDSIGAQLTLINTVTDNIRKELQNSSNEINQNIEKLSYFSEKSISELKNALWVLNSNEITLDDFRLQLHNYIQKFEDIHPNILITYKFTIFNNILLHSKLASNLFRIIQEFINNSLKHSNSDKMWIIIQQNEKAIFMDMRDNGIGFELTDVKPDSYGIANLRHRVSSMDGIMDLFSEKGRGTQCKISINLES